MTRKEIKKAPTATLTARLDALTEMYYRDILIADCPFPQEAEMIGRELEARIEGGR